MVNITLIDETKTCKRAIKLENVQILSFCDYFQSFLGGRKNYRIFFKFECPINFMIVRMKKQPLRQQTLLRFPK